MVYLPEHPGRQHLRGVEYLRDVLDRGAGHSREVQEFNPLVAGARAEHVVQYAEELVPVLHPVRIGVEPGIRCQLRFAGTVAEPRPDRLVGHGHHEMAVGGGEALVRHDVGMRVAPAAGHVAGHEIVAAGIDQAGNLRFHEGGFDPLPFAGLFAGVKGRRDGVPEHETGDDVDDGDPHLRRLAVGGAGDAHQAAPGLNGQVVSRPVLQRPAGAEGR